LYRVYVGNNCKVLYEYSNLYVGDHDEVPDGDRMYIVVIMMKYLMEKIMYMLMIMLK
jgi:hypothetical protein